MERLQIVIDKDGKTGWIDEILYGKIRACFFNDNCDLMSKKYFKENFELTEDFI